MAALQSLFAVETCCGRELAFRKSTYDELLALSRAETISNFSQAQSPMLFRRRTERFGIAFERLQPKSGVLSRVVAGEKTNFHF